MAPIGFYQTLSNYIRETGTYDVRTPIAETLAHMRILRLQYMSNSTVKID